MGYSKYLKGCTMTKKVEEPWSSRLHLTLLSYAYLTHTYCIPYRQDIKDTLRTHREIVCTSLIVWTSCCRFYNHCIDRQPTLCIVQILRVLPTNPALVSDVHISLTYVRLPNHHTAAFLVHVVMGVRQFMYYRTLYR